jgi:hypothetical protein
MRHRRGRATPVLSAALFTRFGSQNADDFANKITSAMRSQSGGTTRKPPDYAVGTPSRDAGTRGPERSVVLSRHSVGSQVRR